MVEDRIVFTDEKTYVKDVPLAALEKHKSRLEHLSGKKVFEEEGTSADTRNLFVWGNFVSQFTLALSSSSSMKSRLSA